MQQLFIRRKLTIVKTKSLDDEDSCVEAKQKCDNRKDQCDAVCQDKLDLSAVVMANIKIRSHSQRSGHQAFR